jgi:phospholipase C
MPAKLDLSRSIQGGNMRKKIKLLLRRGVAVSAALGLAAMQSGIAGADGYGYQDPNAFPTATPIKHIIVIFGENISFDHYYGTYPSATNPAGEPTFYPSPWTPNVNGLNGALLTNNPNYLNTTGNGSNAANPFRLDRSQNFTNDQDHDYTPEQEAFDHGLMDAFPEFTGTAGPPPDSPPPAAETQGLVMGYFDGNTVTALWNYAQHYALNDNAYGTNFGPSTDGALNLISGQTNGAVATGTTSSVIGDGYGGFTLISDINPTGDQCSGTGVTASMTGQNIGNLLNAASITWGWFEGGFNLTVTNSNGTSGCNRDSTSAITGATEDDYIPHHQPFQYYASTANPTHLRPTGPIGQTDQANHQYDIQDWFTALNAGYLPAVSFLKAIGIQDAHPGYSSPLDEQQFIVSVVNSIQQSPFWKDTAIVIQYDDSDGWYDHQMGPIINQSATAADELTGDGACGTGDNALPGVDPTKTPHAQGRCGYGPRIPIMVISPYAKANFIDHTLADQSSTIHFIEDNWLGGTRIGGGSADAISGTLNNMFDFNQRPSFRPYLLNPDTGEPL